MKRTELTITDTSIVTVVFHTTVLLLLGHGFNNNIMGSKWQTARLHMPKRIPDLHKYIFWKQYSQALLLPSNACEYCYSTL